MPPDEYRLGVLVKTFITTEYTFRSKRIGRQPLKFVMISDLHNVTFGRNNSLLLEEIQRQKPDALLIAGDLLTAKPGCPVDVPVNFIQKAVPCCPVYYALGNHEYRMKIYPETYHHQYETYEKELKKHGVILLENNSRTIEIKGTRITFYGLALNAKYYTKIRRHKLPLKEMEEMLGKPDQNSYNILLAHNPKFAPEYFAWGAQLTLSGHYHGGVVRLPFNRGLISPYFTIFPKYCYGKYTSGNQHLVVGAGLGEHTIPIRIGNPRELVVIHLVEE